MIPAPQVDPRTVTTADGQPLVQPDGLLVPSHRSFAAIYNELSGVYWTKFDEAMRDSSQNALAMRRDVHLRALLQERLMPTVNARWAAAVDDDKDPEQVRVRDGVKRLVREIPRFTQLRHCLLEAVWYGRSGVQGVPGRAAGGGWTWVRWSPIHGDSLQFSHDDTPILMVDNKTAQQWRAKYPELVVNLDRGGWGVRLERPEHRRRVVVHRHQVNAADYFEGEFAGQVHGEGLRSVVYWANWLRTEAFSWMLSFCQGTGSADLLLVNYADGNKAAKANAEAIAKSISGKIAIACPRDPKEHFPLVEAVPANTAGMEFLRDLIGGYWDKGIERLFVGQSMSAGGGGSGGLEGDGRAELARDTKAHLIDFDAGNLDETLTKDLFEVVKQWNYPAAKFPVRCKASNPEAEAQRRLEVGLKLVSAGVPVKADELRELAGFTKPAAGDEVAGGAQQPPPGTTGAPQPGVPGGGPPLTPTPPQPAPGQPGRAATNGGPTEGTPDPKGQGGEGSDHLAAAVAQLVAEGVDPDLIDEALDDDAGGAVRYDDAGGAVRYQWQAARTKTGGVKAVWAGAGTKAALYGRRAEAALRSGAGGAADPAAGERLVAQALTDPRNVPVQQIGDLARHLAALPKARQQEVARQLRQKVTGTKAELAERIVARVRQLAERRKVQKGGPNPDLPAESRPWLNGAEKVALREYTGAAYLDLNRGLREAGTPPAELAAVHAGLESAFAKAKPFKPPVRVVRRVFVAGEARERLLAAARNAAANRTQATMPGYLSSSTNPDEYLNATDPGSGDEVMFEIEAVHGLDAVPYSEYASESELLLPHNSRFTVSGVARAANGVPVVKLRQVYRVNRGAGPVELTDRGHQRG